MFSFFFYKYLHMEFLGHNIDACLTFLEITSFLKQLYQTLRPGTKCKDSSCSLPSLTFDVARLLYFNYPSEMKYSLPFYLV